MVGGGVVVLAFADPSAPGDLALDGSTLVLRGPRMPTATVTAHQLEAVLAALAPLDRLVFAEPAVLAAAVRELSPGPGGWDGLGPEVVVLVAVGEERLALARDFDRAVWRLLVAGLSAPAAAVHVVGSQSRRTLTATSGTAPVRA